MKLTILAGVSGSGKSTYAKKLGGIICSADDHFVDADGVYRFDPSQLGEAHRKCLRNVVLGLQRFGEHIVVDNTNTTLVELAPYVALGQAFYAQVEIVVVVGNPADAARRNIHGVPHGSVMAMAKRIDEMLHNWPPFWPTPLIVGQ